MTSIQESALTALRERLEHPVTVVGVVGLGYVGLPQAVAFAEAGSGCWGWTSTRRSPRRSGGASAT